MGTDLFSFCSLSEYTRRRRPASHLLQLGLATGLLAVIAGCVDAQNARPGDTAQMECRTFLARLDQISLDAGTQDLQARRLSGFPHLRSTRFLAGIADLMDTPAKRKYWAGALAVQAMDGFVAEINNLPDDYLGRLGVENRHLGTQRAVSCVQQEARRTGAMGPSGIWPWLVEQAAVPDAYIAWRRALGLYPLMVLPVARGIHNWHEEVRHTWGIPLASLPVRGRLQRVSDGTAQSMSREETGQALRTASDNAPGLPMPQGATAAALFNAHAPVWEVDVADNNDLIGTPAWSADGARLRIDTGQPRVYRKLSHTRYGKELLLQLNYIVWFPARPKTGPLDLLGGELDGLVWRVTLSPEGEPLMYDSIHNCGCYHLFFPTAQMQPRPAPDSLAEVAFVPQTAPVLKAGDRIVLRIASHNHFIDRIYTEPAEHAMASTRHISNADYNTLRSLPVHQQRRQSLFGQHGLIEQSDRAERYLFWPLGVRSAGAMRQWGSHATAFVGRRHFDEARLLQRYFRWTPR